MKKFVFTMVAVLLVSILFAVPALATITNGAEADGSYKADAKAILPDKYSEVYGVEVTFALEEAGMMGTGIQVHTGTPALEGGTPLIYLADTALEELYGMMGMPLPSSLKSVEFEVGKSRTEKYMFITPLFSGDTANIIICAEPGEPSIAPKFKVDKIVWLDKDGKDITAAAEQAPGTAEPAPTNPKTSDNSMIVLAVIVFLVAGFLTVRLVKGKKAAN